MLSVDDRPRRLSFAGCGSRDGAIERMSRWLHDIHANEIRALETNLLLCEGADDPDPDPDHVDACVDYMRASHAEAREEALRFVREMFDEHNIGPATADL